MDRTHARWEPPPELDRLAHQVIGAAIEVHRVLGPGYLESVYEAALGVELAARGIAFIRQAPVSVEYKGTEVGAGRLDFLVDQQLVIELKAVEKLMPIHMAQVLSYLKATELNLGLVLNFNELVLKDGIRRVIRSPDGQGSSGTQCE